MTSVQLSNRGVILSYTSLDAPIEGLIPPVMLALVELDRGAVILALADKNEIENIEIDNAVLLQQDDENRFAISTAPQ
ncbi:MAG: OB-fold domain-containing protein [Candidatus Thorarchaeota archaeon]